MIRTPVRLSRVVPTMALLTAMLSGVTSADARPAHGRVLSSRAPWAGTGQSAGLVFAAAGGRNRAATPYLQVLAYVGGQPDDVAVDARGRLVWGDLARHAVYRLAGRQVTLVASHLPTPEGVVPLRDGSIVVVEQASDRVLRLDAHGHASVVYRLRPVAGKEGADGLGRDPRTGDLLLPDSPRGRVLRMGVDGRHARVIARGLGRPVAAAVDRAGNILVPDENLRTLVKIGPHGRVSHMGVLATPDDVAVDRNGRVWVTTLGDGGLWSIAPGGAPRRIWHGLNGPQGLALDRCGNPIVTEQGAGRIDRLLLAGPAARCRL